MSHKISIMLISIFVIVFAYILGSQSGKYFGDRKRLEQKRELSRKIISDLRQLKIGDSIPNHEFELIGDGAVHLYDLLSEKCVLILSVPQCQECLFEVQELGLAIKDSNDPKYFLFVSWENPRMLEDFRNENKLSSPFLYDHKRVYLSQFDISTYPFNLTLDKNGRILDMLAGPMLKEDFEKIIEFNKKAEIAEN